MIPLQQSPRRVPVEKEEDDIEDIGIFIVGGEVIVRDAASNSTIATNDSILIVLLNFEGISFTL